jgi:hypothetical protein
MPAGVQPRPSPEDRIRAALWFAERGFGVFTVWSTDPDGTCRCPARARCTQPGKHPVTAHGFRDATRDPERIRTLLSAGSQPNYGLVCPDGVFALDVDGEGVAQLAALEQRLGALPPTLRTRTAHGEHVFLRWPEALPRPIGQLWGYVTRWGSGANAGYVIGPRSVHATGVEYEPEGTFEIAELPEAWAQDVITPPEPEQHPLIEIAGGYRLPDVGYRGSRYDAIRDYIASRYMRGMSRDEVLAGVLSVLAPRFADPLTEPELRARFDRAWKGTPERLGPPLAPTPAPRPIGSGMDAADLLALDLPPLRWLVPDLIPEGTTILAARPKVGKSCLVYQMAVEASIGGSLLGRRVTPGSVLYLALEDGKRRGQDRLRAALGGRTMPHGRLEVRWDAHKIGEGLEEDLTAWLDGHPDAVMVAIDTLGKVRPTTSGRQGAYEIDVQHLARLQDLFRNRTVALVIVHHARKEAADDFLASVSGTYGITGSADTIVVIKRNPLERLGSIHATGRDIADAKVAATFDEMLWREAPDSLSEASFDRSEVYQVIEESGPIYAKGIAERIGKERTNVQHMVEELVRTGAVARTGLGYVVARVSLVASPNHSRFTPKPLNVPTHSTHSESDQSDSRDVREGKSDWSDSGHTREAGAGGWLHPCRDYAHHRSSHRQTPEGWTCLACYPEGDPA